MSNDPETAKRDLEKVYSILIKELEEIKNNYEKEKENINKTIKDYQNIVDKIFDKIKDIENDEKNYIAEKKENNLYPEYSHIVEILGNKKVFYESIVRDLESKKDYKMKELDERIEECKKTIDKYNSDIDIVKQAIYENGLINLKINEIVDLKDLKKYARQNEQLLHYNE